MSKGLVAGKPAIADLKELIQSDIAAWVDVWYGSGQGRNAAPRAASIRLVWSQVGLRATILYRISHALRRCGVKVLPGMVQRLNVMLYGLDVPASVPIGPRLYIPHPVGTVIMAERIGENVTLVSSVTIGMRKERIFPRIGNNVYIGAGARVLGDITIGDHVSIGANAVVLRDVPEGATAVGVPAIIRSGKAATKPFGQGRSAGVDGVTLKGAPDGSTVVAVPATIRPRETAPTDLGEAVS